MVQSLNFRRMTNSAGYASLRHTSITSTRHSFSATSPQGPRLFSAENASLRQKSITSPKNRHFTKKASLRQNNRYFIKKASLRIRKFPKLSDLSIFLGRFFGEVSHFRELKRSGACGEVTHWRNGMSN